MKKETKQKVSRQLKIIEGQVRGLQKMVEDEKYCIDILTQASAIRSSISSVEERVLENHLLTHVIEQMRGPGHLEATKELLEVYKLAKKNNK